MIFWDEFLAGIGIILDPASRTRKTMDAEGVFSAYYRIIVVPLVLLLVTGGLSIFFRVGFPFAGLRGSIFAVGAMFLFLFLIPIAMLVRALVYHLFGKVLFAAFRGSFESTLSAVYYSVLPFVLLAWVIPVPVLGVLAIIVAVLWSLAVFVASLSNLHKISRLAAFGAVVSAWVCIAIVVAVAAVTLFSAFAQTAGGHWFNGGWRGCGFGRPALVCGMAGTMGIGGSASQSVRGYYYTGVYNGSMVQLQLTGEVPVENLTDSFQTGLLTNFQTNNPQYSCLDGSSILVWSAPDEYQNASVAHNGGQGPQCTYITLIMNGTQP